MNNEVITALQAVISQDMGNAFQVYADILVIALPFLFAFGACSWIVNLVCNAAFKGKIQWWGK